MTPFIPSEARDITGHEGHRQDTRGEPLKMYYVYIIQSLKDHTLYVGFTPDLKERLAKHNAGNVVSTRMRRPFKLIFYEAFLCEKDAIGREKYLKSGWGLRSIKELLRNYLLKR